MSRAAYSGPTYEANAHDRGRPDVEREPRSAQALPGGLRRLAVILVSAAGVMGLMGSETVSSSPIPHSPGGMADPATSWLGSTAMVQSDSPEIRSLAARLTEGLGTDRERALAIYRFVRDEIEFGWTGAFYQMTASQVLKAEKGFCNTKGTLFIALLRSVGIPARQHFVDLRSDILYGLVQTGGPYVDHSYSEVFLDGRWIAVDSYAVDRRLYQSARGRLIAEGRALGYGVHVNGVSEWDGRSDSFVQFVDDGSVPRLSRRDFGTFADVADFYASVEQTWNKRSGVDVITLRLLLPLADRAAVRVRARGAGRHGLPPISLAQPERDSPAR